MRPSQYWRRVQLLNQMLDDVRDYLPLINKVWMPTPSWLPYRGGVLQGI
jgi:hypothetical protein